MRKVILLTTVVLSAFGCGEDDASDEHGQHGDGTGQHGGDAPIAEVTLAAKSGNATLAGTATFEGDKGSVKVTVDVTGAPAGEHGVHIHETGDCSAPDAMSAGGHWNPTMQMHGMAGGSSHLGDLGNLTIAADGKGTLTLTNPAWEIGTGGANDVVGKALVVHAMADDFATQPTGNSGGRIGCGVIE